MSAAASSPVTAAPAPAPAATSYAIETIAKPCIKTHRIFFWCTSYLGTSEHVLEALKEHFKDVCSGGDVCMQKLIAFLETQPDEKIPTHEAIKTFYDSEEVVRHYWEICWRRLRNTLSDWLDEGALCPDPFYAD
jgi:hypothetical protein